MSRRPQAPDRSEQNRATLKSLVKLEANKSCADCKRNKHPRWASWNIGVFVCIRCSGIHRSMGVHISRVKSVDLDTWTDEQMASMLRWGNARANKYWEAKLAPGHVPNESKIENFIRTKYDSKRWVMDGPMPDPTTLDEEGADDDVPLNVVQEKAKMERDAAVRNGAGIAAPPRAPPVDLFGDPTDSAPARPSTTEPATGRVPAKTSAAPAKQTKPGESLLGLDFFGSTQAGPPRPASSAAATSSAGGGRADLKNSILSLYASAPKPTAAPAATTAQSNAQDPFGGSVSQYKSNSSALGELGDAFGGMNFSSSTTAQPPKPAFGSVSPPAVTAQTRQPSALSGGSFFDTKPAPPPKPVSPPQKQNDTFGDFGGFETSSAPTSSSRSAAATSSKASNDLFDLSSPAPPPVQSSKPPPISASNYTAAAAFNLSQPKSTPAPIQSQVQATSFPSMSTADAWGSNDAWATPDPAPVAAPPAQTSTTAVKSTATAPIVSTSGGWGDSGGWGEPEQTPVKPATTPAATSSGGFTVQQDEEFGGWSHASPVATSGSAKPATLGGNTDDLFGNVWN